MHLCEDELTSTSQTSLTHADKCQSPTSHESWPWLLSDWRLVHPQQSCHSCFQWRIHLCFRSCCSRHVCWADAFSPMHAAGIVLLEFMQLFATCFCNTQHFLWIWLSQTKCRLTSYCSLSDIFLVKPFTVRVSFQPCWPFLVSKLLIQLPLSVGGDGCLHGLFGMVLLFLFLWPNLYLDSFALI